MKNSEKAWTQAALRNMETTELKALLRQDLEAEDTEALPVELLQEITSILQDREQASGTYKQRDADCCWEFFRKNHLQATVAPVDRIHALPAKQRHQRSSLKKPVLHRFVAVAIIAATLFAGSITAWAMGFDIWGAIARWTDETFHFEASQSVPSTEMPEPTTLQPKDFQAIAEKRLPSWIPNGYAQDDPEILENDVSQIYFSSYTDGAGGYFNIQIIKYASPEYVEDYHLEKSDEPIIIYERGDDCFYIMTNENTMTASWSDGQLVEIISGSLTEEELKTMIDSIGG